MKKFYTIIAALLMSVSGAWAASPAVGAYPVVGKTYYLFANKYSSTDRYYLYWDNTNSVLKHNVANTKESSDYYKWTVTSVNEGVYTITNVGMNTKLTWDTSKGLTLGNGSNFDLSKTVHYTACVSLWTANVGWCCVQNTQQTFANGLKFGSFPADQYCADYSLDFVFEEALTAHPTLTDGQYYTIYCDNDSKQYLCTNGATLTATDVTPTTATSNCIWKCIVNGEYYNFQNLATGLYLGWKAMQSTAYNFTVGTANVLHDGCATIWGVNAQRFLNLKVDGNFDQGNGSFNKITTDYCSEFRFEAVTPTYGTRITDLGSLSNDKAYVITNARGTWNFADNATAMSVASLQNLVDNAQQIAILNHEGNYYLFSVNAGKYLTANNSLTSMPSDNEQVDIVATGNASYPWFFRFKMKDANNKYTKNINTTTQPSITIDGWGPDGSNANGCFDGGNSNAIIVASNFDATAALNMFSTRTVSYKLFWSDGTQIGETVNGITTTLSGDAADFIPDKFKNSFVTLSCSPATITSGTTEVTVTATWNGPFQISGSYASAVWQVVQMHTYPGYPAEKWSWSYKSDDSNKVKPEQVLAYDAVTTNRLFCFVGNPYAGFKIYNAAAGSGYTLTRSGESDEIAMASGDHIFTLHASSASPDVSTYFCLKPSGATNYINYDYNNKMIAGWSDADNGSTCWVVAPGQYYLDFIDGLNLDAPIGAVGTRAYFQSVANVETVKSNIRGYRTTVVNNMYSNELGSLNEYLNPVKATDVITLADGYYRIVSAVPGFNQTAAWYYNPAVSTDHITWAKAATTTEHQVNSIFKFTAASDDKWNIFSPNAQNYLIHDNTAFNAQTGSIGDEAGAVEVSSIGSAQHTLRINAQTVHAYGHNGGTGSAGNLINWNANDPGAASTWYLVKVEDVDLTLNGPVDSKYYATLCLPFDVTITGATAYTMEDKDSYLQATEVKDNKVPAGTPVLLKGDAATATATINNGEAFNSGSPLSSALVGTYVDKSVTGSTDYFLGKDDTYGVGFYHWDGSTLKANRAYLPYLPAGENSKGFALVFDDDDVTAVDALIVNGQSSMVNGYYDLQGRKVAQPQKGQLYIHNGKKVLY